MKKLIIVFVAGLLCGLCSPAIAATVKQYILTEAPYPVVVNGTVYKDEKHPILNYEGSTYVPLAKLGDITGVKYTWNSKLRQVDIVTDAKKSVTLKPDTIVEKDEVKGYNGVSDEADVNIHFAGKNSPPLLSEGWVSEKLLDKVLGYSTLYGDGPNYTVNYDIVKIDKNYKVYLTLDFPEGWSQKNDGEVTVQGIKVKRFMKTNYYNIKDLESALGIS